MMIFLLGLQVSACQQHRASVIKSIIAVSVVEISRGAAASKIFFDMEGKNCVGIMKGALVP